MNKKYFSMVKAGNHNQPKLVDTGIIRSKTFPTIQRSDVMSCILSEFVTEEEKKSLSVMYSEITRMEMKDMKYITEIAISSREDAEIYDTIRRVKQLELVKYENE